MYIPIVGPVNLICHYDGSKVLDLYVTGDTLAQDQAVKLSLSKDTTAFTAKSIFKFR